MVILIWGLGGGYIFWVVITFKRNNVLIQMNSVAFVAGKSKTMSFYLLLYQRLCSFTY